ncbi:MAG TPA: hypothetical protein VHD36_08495 [Pirellulales bacterium]|nr:hypothetical protein [Pirellulales bacterium]
MGVTFDPTGDMSCCDGLEAVTLRQLSGAAGGVVNGALRRQMRTSEAEASDARYLATDLVWHLPAEQLPIAPAVGSVITDSSGVRYIVLEAQRATLGARWQCRARNLAIVSGLDQPVTLQQATWTKSPSGAQVAVWHNVQINLAARIQPQQADIRIEYDRRLTRVTHKIFVADEIAVDHTYRVIAGDDMFRVLGYQRPEQLDGLFTILASQTTGAIE